MITYTINATKTTETWDDRTGQTRQQIAVGGLVLVACWHCDCLLLLESARHLHQHVYCTRCYDENVKQEEARRD